MYIYIYIIIIINIFKKNKWSRIKKNIFQTIISNYKVSDNIIFVYLIMTY
jgi:hypothetical protein